MKTFDTMNPLCAAFYYLCVLGITMFSMNPLLLVISLAASIANAAIQNAASRRANLFAVIVFLIAAIINPIVVHNGETALLYFNDNPITLEAVMYGIFAAVMIVSALYWLRGMTKVLSSDKVMYLFGRISPKLALLISMSLRYVELFKQRWRRIQESQKALGLYDDGNLIDAVKGRARVLSILITWALENGIITAECMEARGYGSRRRSSYSAYRFHLSDGLFIIICAVLTALTVIGVYHSSVVYYPSVQMELWNPWGIAGAAAFALLSILPLIMKGKEAVKWRILLSKI